MPGQTHVDLKHCQEECDRLRDSLEKSQAAHAYLRSIILQIASLCSTADNVALQDILDHAKLDTIQNPLLDRLKHLEQQREEARRLLEEVSNVLLRPANTEEAQITTEWHQRRDAFLDATGESK